jgi:hypothetical protein
MQVSQLRIEEGEIILLTFQGEEFVIETGRTRLYQALGEIAAFEFIKKLLDRSMFDAISLSNFSLARRRPTQKAAAAETPPEDPKGRTSRKLGK